MTSLGKIAQCIGLSDKVGVRQNFFGYRTNVPLRLSVLSQVRLLQGKHIHLNLIQTATFSPQNLKEIDYGLQTMRNIYATVNIGVGRILRYSIPPGFEVIDDDSEAQDLWNAYSVSNDGIDVFLALSIVGNSSGKSPTGGSCDKDSKDDSGCVIPVDDNADGIGLTVGQAIAHEVGHFLGLSHEDELEDNLMYPIVPNGGRLYGGQGGSMVLHCSIRSGCH
jgi:hypothetical protein